MERDDQGRVTVSVVPWLSESLDPQATSALILEEVIPPNATLRTLLHLLADRYARFSDAIYDPQSDLLRPSVVITHNGQFIPMSTALDLPLQSGDRISLIPVYPGG